MTSEPPVPPAMPPSWMTPANDEPLVMVSVFDPRLTLPSPPRLEQAADGGARVGLRDVERGRRPPAKPTKAELAIEPFPFSARVAPGSICVALV